MRSRQLHEDVIECGGAQGQGADAKRGGIQGNRHWAQLGGAVLSAHHDPSRFIGHCVDAIEDPQPGQDGGIFALDLGNDEILADRAFQLFG